MWKKIFAENCREIQKIHRTLQRLCNDINRRTYYYSWQCLSKHENVRPTIDVQTWQWPSKHLENVSSTATIVQWRKETDLLLFMTMPFAQTTMQKIHELLCYILNEILPTLHNFQTSRQLLSKFSSTWIILCVRDTSKSSWSENTFRELITSRTT